ncbi:MAG: HAMP domain-containing protein, partial [bacterium]|nr:HAMP domain-containing protein [bacterium]
MGSIGGFAGLPAGIPFDCARDLRTQQRELLPMPETPETTSNFFRDLPVGRKLAGLALLFASTLIGVVTYTVLTLNQQKADASVINVAGRQRMLTQKYTKELLDELSGRQVLASTVSRVETAAAQVLADRAYYAKNVVGKLKRDDSAVYASPDYAGVHNAIPAPATFTQEVADIIRGGDAGYEYELLSKYNIDPEKGLKTEIGEAAWAALAENPDTPFTRVVARGTGASLFYARADLAKQGCVSCHNALPSSPKRDFRVGDLMGLLVLKASITNDANLAAQLLTTGAEAPYQKTRKLFEVSLAALREGGATFSDLGMQKELLLPGTQNTEIQQQLAVVAEKWGALQTTAAAIAQDQVNSAAYLANMSEIRTLNIETLKNMNKAVGMFAAESSGKVAAMITMEWIILALALVLGGWVSFTIAMGITRPLQKLSEAVIGVGKTGDLSLRAEINGRDEIGRTVSAFNQLMESQQHVITEVNGVVGALADGDFSKRVEVDCQGDFKRLKSGVNTSTEQ